ncbi:DUF6932 family protein [Crystallibacter degradans]|uniref:DUF6932 family protein n=1 Tax=Crystallibacter degradans TaxID=2726743 RepID=UPI003F877BB4
MQGLQLLELVGGPGGHQVLPVGVHRIGMSHFLDNFVRGQPDERHRLGLMKDFIDYMQVLRGHGLHIDTCLVDGSFVTSKQYPADLDCTPLIDGGRSTPPAGILGSIHDHWVSPGSRYKKVPVPGLGRTVELDVYGIVRIPQEHRNHALGSKAEQKWEKFWQMSRGHGTDAVKGSVEVSLDD